MKNLHSIAMLIDFYGGLLTPRQQEWIRAYYLDDLSLAEIAGEAGVSRQAVHDLIKRSEAALEDFEQKLGFVREHMVRVERIHRLEEAVLREDLTAVRSVLAELKEE